MNKELKCNIQSVHKGIKRGRLYSVIAEDFDKRQVTIRDENGRKRQYPLHCFVSPETELVRLLDWSSDDECVPESLFVEVDVHLSDSTTRVVNILTDKHVCDLMSDTKESFKVLPPFILVREIDRKTISEALQYLDSQALLLEYSNSFGS